MAKIQVYLHNQMVSELLLLSGQEYFAGRGANCDIILANERGISRQHIRFYEENGVWQALIVSKYGLLNHNGTGLEKVTLNEDLKFIADPYTFHYIPDVAPKVESEPPANFITGDLSTHPAALKPNALTENQQNTKDEATTDSGIYLGPTTDSASILNTNLKTKNNLPTENTAVVEANLVVHLKIINKKNKTEEVLKLEGSYWLAGRQDNCDVVIEDKSCSRRHFEIKKDQTAYFITDNGSSNGTFLNGEKLIPNKSVKISSGDVISIKHIEILFELHDSEFSKKVNQLIPIENTEYSVSGELQLSSENWNQTPELDLNEPNAHTGAFKTPFKKWPLPFELNPIRVIIGGLILVLLIGLLVPKENKSPSLNKEKNDLASQQPGAELTPDKQREINDTFNLAQNYYMQRKFVMCVSQLEKLHSNVSFYQNSKELELLCRQAQELEQIELDRKRKDEERAIAENKIRATVEDCKKAVHNKTTSADLMTCLQPALELDPQNGLIVELQNQVAMKEAQLQEQQLQKQNYNKRRLEGLALFQRANQLYASGDLKNALVNFQKFIRGNYPELGQKESEAKRNIASIKNDLEQKINHNIQICQTSLDRSELKNAILACDNVLKEYPDNAKAEDLRKKAYSQLKREMKALYDDAALEESLGNIESAKEKWLRIKDTSVPGEDYFQKAKNKLSKYGLIN